MKAKVLLPALLSLFAGVFMALPSAMASINDSEKEQITVSSTPDLMPLAEMWMNGYTAQHPGYLLQYKDLSQARKSGDAMSIAFIPENDWNLLEQKPAWKMVVGREVVVPVMNAANPLSGLIAERGFSPEQLAGIFSDQRVADWGILLGLEPQAPVHIYTLNNSVVQSAVSGFLGIDPSLFRGIQLESEEALIAAIAGDPNGIGFCRIVSVPDVSREGVPSQVVLLPIDKNGNGKLDYHEKIYASKHDLLRGVWIGKYHRALVQTIYAISDVNPAGRPVSDFMKWVVTDGQQFLDGEGYSQLVYTERQSKIDDLRGPEVFAMNEPDRLANIEIVLLVILGVVLAGLVVNSIVRSRRKARYRIDQAKAKAMPVNENSVDIPAGLYYDKTHTWVYMDKCGYAKIGVDDFLQHLTGSYTRVNLKKPGDRVRKNEPVLTLVQDGKQLIVNAPISGTIKAVNEDLEEEPYLINNSPYDRGWVYLLEPSNWQREIQFMRMAVSYKEWLVNEFSRFKDFLAEKVNAKSFAFAQVTFQEGGEISDHIMENFGPEIWEEFQKYFIETSN
jgi:glycine cleavage system H lipoate-binding protein/ABC-type phosphate transport system substrate-binding protein